MPNLPLSILLDAAKIAAVASVIGFVYVTILTQPGQVLSWWKTLVYKWYAQISGENYFKYEWILNPIIACELCVSGQIALWTYLIFIPFHIIGLIFSICLTILIVKLISQLTR